MKTWWRPSPIAPGNIWIYFISHLFSIIGNKFHLRQEFLHWYCHLMMFFSVFFWSWIYITFIRSHHSCHRHWSRMNVLHTTTIALNKHMLKLLTFKWVLNELLLETNLSEVMLIWWFADLSQLNLLDLFWNSLFEYVFFKLFPL